jgi:hypothetical protein
MHGPGTRRRVRLGLRKDPRTARITHGRAAQPENWARFIGEHPVLAERLAYYETEKKELRSLDRLLALAWSMVDLLSSDSPGWKVDPETGIVRPPPLVGTLRVLSELLERVSRTERQFVGKLYLPVEAVDGLTMVKLVQEYVPRSRQAGATAQIREALRQIDGSVGIRAATQIQNRQVRRRPSSRFGATTAEKWGWHLKSRRARRMWSLRSHSRADTVVSGPAFA